MSFKPTGRVTGEGAFPVPNGYVQKGLTKLEYFAAAALQGLCAGDTEWTAAEADTARKCVKLAKALIIELEKPQTNEP